MKTLKLCQCGHLPLPWWFLLKDPDGLEAFLPYSQSQGLGEDRMGEQERWLPTVDSALRQAPFQLRTSEPRLFLGRRVFPLVLLFSEIDFSPLEASERVS